MNLLKIPENLFYLSKVSLAFYRTHDESAEFHKLAQEICADLIDASYEVSNQELDPKAFKKIQWYMVSTFFMGKLLNILFDETIDYRKKRLLFCTGAVIGISDILIDECKLTKERIEDLFFEKCQPEIAIEKIFKIYLEELFRLLGQDKKESFMESLIKGGYYQIDSLRQLDNKIEEKTIHEITEGKGGMSVIVCAKIFDNYHKKFEQPLFILGGFVQYLNDAQDLHKDVSENISTFVQFREDFDDIKSFLNNHQHKSFKAIKNIEEVSAQKLNYFLFCFYTMHLGICYKVDQYKKILNNKIDILKIESSNKQDFRVDMLTFHAFYYVLKNTLTFDAKKYA